jgi:hypothetical protein
MAEIFKSLNTGSISASGYAEVNWTPDRDIVIKKMLLNERGDASLANVQVYITISDVPYTKDYVPGTAIGKDLEYCWEPNLAVAKGAKIYVKITNSRTAAINVDVVFVYE